jgi:endonuclease-3
MELNSENLVLLDDLLIQAYGPRPWRSHGSALDILILTVLTQATNDLNSHRVFKELKVRFPNWDEVLDASPEDLIPILKAGGLAQQKAARIQGILGELMEEKGEFSLEFLKDWQPLEAFDYLLGFKGVGPKTAACTLLFAWNMQVFPVDTHIHRISKRLGLVDEGTNAVKTRDLWQGALPTGRAYSLHVGLIEHGRRTCVARNPKCFHCNLTSICDFFKERRAAEDHRRS